jgi:hypothetical protein
MENLQKSIVIENYIIYEDKKDILDYENLLEKISNLTHEDIQKEISSEITNIIENNNVKYMYNNLGIKDNKTNEIIEVLLSNSYSSFQDYAYDESLNWPYDMRDFLKDIVKYIDDKEFSKNDIKLFFNPEIKNFLCIELSANNKLKELQSEYCLQNPNVYIKETLDSDYLVLKQS